MALFPQTGQTLIPTNCPPRPPPPPRPADFGILTVGLSLHQLCAPCIQGRQRSSRSSKEGRGGTMLCGQHGNHSVALPSFHPREPSHCAYWGHHLFDPLLLIGPGVSVGPKGNKSPLWIVLQCHGEVEWGLDRLRHIQVEGLKGRHLKKQRPFGSRTEEESLANYVDSETLEWASITCCC